MINFRPALQEDVSKLKLREQYKAEPGVRNAFYRAILGGYPAYSLVHRNGEILAVFAGEVIWPGVVSCSALISQEIKKYPIGTTRAVLQLMHSLQKLHSIHRIQLTVRDDFKEAKRWVTYMGFYCEGTLYGYGQDKSDYLMMARYF